jgi:hypothetical protein
MTNNSNQTGALLLLAVVLGAAVYAFMFFGISIEQTNVSASFGHITKSKIVNLASENKEAASNAFQTKEIRSDLSGVSLPGYKMKSTSGGDYVQSTNVDFPSTGIDQANTLNLNESSSSSTRTRSTGNYAHNQSQSFAFGNSDVQYISNPQNPTKSDINALLLIDTHAAETAMSSQSQQGSKRATSALAAKTASVSTSLTDSKAAKKVDGDPGDPGASLSIGEGIWILLLMGSGYSFAAYKRSKSNDELASLIR